MKNIVRNLCPKCQKSTLMVRIENKWLEDSNHVIKVWGIGECKYEVVYRCLNCLVLLSDRLHEIG